MGGLTAAQTIDASWRLEGAGVLTWALGALPLPAHDRPFSIPLVCAAADLACVVRSGGDLRVSVSRGVPDRSSAPNIRSEADIARLARRLHLIHWRLREHQRDSRRVDLRQIAELAPGGSIDGIALKGDDLSIRRRSISGARPADISFTTSIARERHLAINWLRGEAALYSRVRADT